jgi:hypothetical protein
MTPFVRQVEALQEVDEDSEEAHIDGIEAILEGVPSSLGSHVI